MVHARELASREAEICRLTDRHDAELERLMRAYRRQSRRINRNRRRQNPGP